MKRDLRVEKISDSRVKLTWEAPTEGEHGGSINPALTYYRIVRQPDNRVLTEEETGTSYTDNVGYCGRTVGADIEVESYAFRFSYGWMGRHEFRIM